MRELTGQQQKLVQLYYRDAISVEVLQAEQQRIANEQAQVERWQSQAVAQVDDVMQALDDALLLLCQAWGGVHGGGRQLAEDGQPGASSSAS